MTSDVLTLGVVLGLVTAACSTSEPPEDTCAFLADSSNCYRKLLAAVEDCLTDESSDGGLAMGTLSADGTSCTYASGRTVAFVGDARRYSSSTNSINVIDVTIAFGGKTCVHYVSTPSSQTFTQPNGGVLQVIAGGRGEIITCPDGSQHNIDAQKAFGGCGDAAVVLSGGLPGISRGGGGSVVNGGLVGLKSDAFSCKSP